MAWVIKEWRLDAFAGAVMARAHDAADAVRREAERDARRLRRLARRESVDAAEQLNEIERIAQELRGGVRAQRDAVRSTTGDDRRHATIAAGASAPEVEPTVAVSPKRRSAGKSAAKAAAKRSSTAKRPARKPADAVATKAAKATSLAPVTLEQDGARPKTLAVAPSTLADASKTLVGAPKKLVDAPKVVEATSEEAASGEPPVEEPEERPRRGGRASLHTRAVADLFRPTEPLSASR